MNETHDGSTIGKSAWQSQPLEAPVISLAFVHQQIDKLNAEIRRETVLVYVSAGVCAAGALFVLLNVSPTLSVPMGYVVRVGLILALLGALYGALLMPGRKTARARPDENVHHSLQAYRAELERSRDRYLQAWRWSILPMLPSALVLLMGGAVYDQRPQAVWQYGLLGLSVIAATALAVWNQRGKAKAFQQELDAVGTL
jgi:cytochrome bd-type quinol oxidase subunit 2